MASTTFSGPVNSTNGFFGSVLTVGSASITTLTGSSANVTVLTSASATVTNLLSTTLTIGTTKVTSGNATSGLVSAQLGYIPVMVGATTAYIALYRSFTL